MGGLQKRQSKSKPKNKNPPAKSEKISKYFPLNQVEPKVSKQALDDSLEDFKSPVAIKSCSQNTWKLNKNPLKPKKTGRKKVTKNSTIEIIKDNFGANGEHMQMAIALSKSTYEAEYGHSSDNADKTETPDISTILQNVKPTSLEQFGFKSAKSVLPVSNPKTAIANQGVLQPSKKNRFKYITPILNLRTEEDRESLIQQKISEILSLNVPEPKCKTIATCHSSKLQKLIPKDRLIWTETDYFYVDSLGLDKDACKCGYLLRDWSTIPGRDKSPDRKIQKSSQQIEVPVQNSRCLSPDLFESEDELDKESLNKSNRDINSKGMNDLTQSDNKRNMSKKVDLVEATIDLTGSDQGIEIRSSSCTKPASFYCLDEFELDDDAFCIKGVNKTENRREDCIKLLTEPEEFNLNESVPKELDVICASFHKDNHVDDEIPIKSDGKIENSRVIIPEDLANACTSSDRIECIMDDPKATDSIFNSLKESFLEDECVIDPLDNLYPPNTSTSEHDILRCDIKLPENQVNDLPTLVEYNTCNASANSTDNCFKDINQDQSPFGKEIYVENLHTRSNFPKTEPSICIVISDDSSTDSSTLPSQTFSKLEILSTHSPKKRKFNDNIVPDQQNVNDINESSNSTVKNAYSNHNSFQDEFVNNDDFCTADNAIKGIPTDLRAKDDNNVQYSFSEDELMENEQYTYKIKTDQADVLNDSLSPLMDTDDYQVSVNMQCAGDEILNSNSIHEFTNDNSSKLKESNMDSSRLEEQDFLEDEKQSFPKKLESEEHSPQTSTALCIEVSDDSSSDEANVDYTATPKASNSHTILGKSPNRKSLNVNSAELNITEYVQKMLNKDKYTFDDVELQLTQESQSSQIDDEELNYSCHFNTPLKSHYTPHLENQMEVEPSKHKSPSLSPQLREEVNTPDNYIIKTRNVTPMPDFDSMSTPVINKELEKIGVKALKRARGVQLLKYIYESTHPLVGTVNVAELDDEEKVIKRRKRSHPNVTDPDTRIGILNPGQIEILGDRLLQQEKLEDLIFERRQSTKIPSCSIPLQIVWHNFVSSNPTIKENILLYEPLHLESLHDMLKQLGFKYHIQDLLSFLDRKCITIRTAQGKRPNKEKQ